MQIKTVPCSITFLLLLDDDGIPVHKVMRIKDEELQSVQWYKEHHERLELIDDLLLIDILNAEFSKILRSTD